MTTPQVSICIPTYNYRRYLSHALDSALAQTFADIEIVVVDNCSDDGTPELMEQYCRRDNRIVFRRNATNIGMTANFNMAMEVARGKYIKFLCADDVLRPECVSSMVAVMESRPDVRLAASRRVLVGPEHGGLPPLHITPRYRIVPGENAIRRCFYHGNFIGEPTAVMFRKEDVRFGFDAQYYQALDMELWFRLLEKGTLAYFIEALCGVRVHDSAGTTENIRAGRIASDKVRLFESYARKEYMRGTIAERIRWDARMASSLVRQSAAGARIGNATVRPALYFPRLVEIVLIPLAGLFLKFGGQFRR